MGVYKGLSSLSGQQRNRHLMNEEWREVVGYPNYLVSNYGEIFSVDKDCKVAPIKVGGYWRVALTDWSGTRRVYVHQLVAAAFFPTFKDGTRVKHVNGNNLDNSVANLLPLSYVDAETNRSMRHVPWGRRVLVVELQMIFRTARDCANYIGGDYSSIYACLRGDRNRHMGYTFEYLEDVDFA